MKRIVVLALLSALFIGVALQAQDIPAELNATITNAAGDEIGTVSISPVTAEMARELDVPVDSLESATAFWIQIQGLTPGFHGFHIHSVGACDPSGERAFASAGGHLQADGQSHGQHMGDLPSLLATESGVAILVFATDRFTVDELLDEDGSAVIIHAGADNYGNIPADRYDPDADEMTTTTGDAGAREACGVISGQS